MAVVTPHPDERRIGVNSLLRKNQKFLSYLLFLLIPIVLIKTQPKLTSIKFAVAESTSLPIRIITFPFYEIKKILAYRWSYREVQRLKKENELLKARMIGLQDVMIENQRFQKLLEFKRNLIFSSVVANVIGRDPNNWNSSIVIDKGERDGLKIGMPVVNSLGVVGKIAEVTPKSSRVILLIDPSFSVAGIDQRSREGGLVSGTLQGVCRLRYLSSKADIKIGDIVVTSRLSSSFPEGLFIGRIISVGQSQSSPGLECLLQPAVSTSQFEEVIVIIK